MSGSKDIESARKDATRERIQKAAKRAVEAASGDVNKALAILVTDIRSDDAAVRLMGQAFLEGVIRDRPDLKDDPDALVEETIKRLRAGAEKRKKAKR
jgi:hypothetical protein